MTKGALAEAPSTSSFGIRASLWKMVLPRGFAPRASAFAKRRADFLHLGSMVSVAGLAPARTGLKGRVLGLLCITDN